MLSPNIPRMMMTMIVIVSFVDCFIVIGFDSQCSGTRTLMSACAPSVFEDTISIRC